MRSGYSFTSFYSNYTYDYVAAKYAKSHETEMKAWADANNADNDYYTFSVQNYISQYYNYLDAFKYSTSLTAEETTLYNQLLSEASQVKLDVLNSALQNSSSSGLYLNVDSYSNNYEDTNRSVKIVGVIVRSADKSLNQIIIMDDETVDGVTGGTENIYKYAVGSLDVSNRSVVTKCVEFSDVTNDGVNYSFKNSVMTQMDLVNSILGVLGQVFLYVGIGFAVFAAIMLSNFIATSISYKRQEIGILRAIGSRSTDVFKIFFAESFIIAMINYVLSLIATGIVTVVLNNVLRSSAGLLITILSFGIREVLLLLAISLGVALIATYLPVRKIAHKKPIDAIRKR
jgi:ABC-type antimicrobial peptide transport system permease subunit